MFRFAIGTLSTHQINQVESQHQAACCRTIEVFILLYLQRIADPDLSLKEVPFHVNYREIRY